MFRFLMLCTVFLHFGFSIPVPPGPIDVDIGLFVHDVGEIDALREMVEIEATLTMSWEDPLGNVNNVSGKNAYFDVAMDPILETTWIPYLYVKNGRGPRKVIQKALFSDGNGNWMYQERFKVWIETMMNVELFPFDKQFLHITMVPFGLPSTAFNFNPNPNWEGIFKARIDSEWQVEDYKTTVVTKPEGPHPAEQMYVNHIKYVRDPGFYLYKIIVPMLALVVLAMMALLMKGDPISNRSQIVLTCILSVIALQLVVYQSIPKVSYAIYIDVLFTISFLTTCAVLLRVALFSSLLFLRKLRKTRTCIDVLLPLCFVGAVIITTYRFFG